MYSLIRSDLEESPHPVSMREYMHWVGMLLIGIIMVLAVVHFADSYSPQVAVLEFGLDRRDPWGLGEDGKRYVNWVSTVAVHNTDFSDHDIARLSVTFYALGDRRAPILSGVLEDVFLEKRAIKQVSLALRSPMSPLGTGLSVVAEQCEGLAFIRVSVVVQGLEKLGAGRELEREFVDSLDCAHFRAQ